jgi:hypothetical protein
LAKWHALLASLQKDLLPISCGHCLPLAKWSSYLELLLQSYFQVESSDKAASDAYGALSLLLKRLPIAASLTKNASLLLPEWIPHFLKGNAENLARNMRSSLEGTFSTLYYDYAHWLFHDLQSLPTAEKLLVEWQPVATRLLAALSKHF